MIIKGNSQILLGFKKTGLGRGLWNHSFAGKVERDEEIVEAASRELEEESGLRVEVEHLEKVGYFKDKWEEEIELTRSKYMMQYQNNNFDEVETVKHNIKCVIHNDQLSLSRLSTLR